MIGLQARKLLAIGATLVLVGLLINGRQPRGFAVDSCGNPDRVMQASFLKGFAKRHPIDGSARSRDMLRIAGFHTNARVWRSQPSWSVMRSYAFKDHALGPIGLRIPLLSTDRVSDELLEVDGVQIPVHVRVQRLQDRHMVTAYFYIHRGQPVSSLFWSTLASSAEQFFRGDSPFTQMAIQGATSGPLGLARADALAWLRLAWTRYAAECGL